MTRYAIRNTTQLLAPLLALALCSVSAVPGLAAERTNLRGQRYGEVLLGKGGLVTPKELDVYNTIGLNDCPQELWQKLDPEKIKAETDSKMVKLNGPRYWTIDGFTATALINPEVKEFGGIKMRHAGTLELSLADKLTMGTPYAVHKVDRKTVWVFDAGKPVFQLIDPDGSVYFMQSFSVQKKEQTMDSLAALGTKLQLPKGWQFRTVTLTKPFELKAENDVAFVVQDDFNNTYQKSTAKADDKL